MESVYYSPELLSTIGVEDLTEKKDFGRERGTLISIYSWCSFSTHMFVGVNPVLSEAQSRDIEKLNKRLNAKSSSKSKKKDDDDDEVLGPFDLKSAPRAILHSAPIMKRSERYIFAVDSLLTMNELGQV